MRYYSDGGPGPASRLVRVHHDGGGGWAFAPAEEWGVVIGWHEPNSHVQAEILALGELVALDPADVERVKQEIRERYAYS